MKYTVESLRQFGIQVAEKAGMSHQDAETLLKNLLFSDMRGVRSHGMTRLSGYVTRIERGCTPATAQPTITMDSGAVFSMDGNNGMGSTIGTAAMQACIRRAKGYGVSFCTRNHASHYGFGGFYGMQAAAEGMIGFNICKSPGCSRIPRSPPVWGTSWAPSTSADSWIWKPSKPGPTPCMMS